jgi:hypothetical protein
MPSLSLGLGLHKNRVFTAGGGGAPFSPADLSGLSLWLKADAGVTTSAETFVGQIILTGSGTPTSDGTYTRASGGNTSFMGQGGNVIENNGGEEFYLYDATAGVNTYTLFISTSSVYSIQVIEGQGDSPAPSSSVSLTNTGNILATAWADQSGNGRNFSQNTEAFPYYVTISGKSFVNFYSNTSIVNGSGIWTSSSYVGTILIVARFVSSNSTSILFLHEDYFYFNRGTGTTNAFSLANDGDSGTIATSSNVNANNNANYILGTTFNGASASLYLNGSSAGTGSIGDFAGGANMFIGGGESSNIAEVVIYDRVLTTGERQQVEAYLNTKYAIY